MLYTVIRQFINIDGSYLRQGDNIECDDNRAKILKRNGLIGLTANKKDFDFPEKIKFENTEEKPVKRHYRKRNRE